MSENRRILAPHKEQDGWAYVRVRPHERRRLMVRCVHGKSWDMLDLLPGSFGYPECWDGRRTISSRRVEEAVETADYLKRCAEDGLVAVFDYSDGWHVGLHTRSVAPLGGQRVTGAHGYGSGTTLREAYWRYKNAVAR